MELFAPHNDVFDQLNFLVATSQGHLAFSCVPLGQIQHTEQDASCKSPAQRWEVAVKSARKSRGAESE